MAGLTEEKRMEMEAEMNRFEQEILVPEDAPRMIIGANTFNKVQAALKAQNEEDEDPPPGTVDTEPVTVQKAPPTADVPPLLPPPPPPPPMMRPPAPPPALRPPPPPPRPAFMPPQLRHRPPAPPPRFPPGPPMNMPHGPPRPPFQGNAPPHHMYGGPPGPRPMGPGPGPRMGMRPNFVPAVNPHYYNRFDGPNNGPPPAGLSGISTSNSAVISKPKVVYSAAPVLKKAKTDIPTSTSDTDKTATEKVPTVSKPTTEAHPVVSEPPSVPPTVSQPGPTLQAPPPAQPQVPMLPDYSLQDLIDLPMDAELVPGHHALKKEKKEKKKRIIRTAAGQCWEDQTLGEWENDDFRIFCGDLGNEVTDDLLTKAFSKYGSFLRAKVVRDKRSNKSKGYGFISFKDPNDFVRAMREMNGKYVGNRPIKLRKSSWKDRNVEVVRRKDKEKKLLGFR